MLKRLAVAIAVLLSTSISAQAVELVIYETPNCPWCLVWDLEIGLNFKDIPIKRRKIYKGMVAPTFIVEDEFGREYGTIIGYYGKKKWLEDFHKIMEKVK